MVDWNEVLTPKTEVLHGRVPAEKAVGFDAIIKEKIIFPHGFNVLVFDWPLVIGCSTLRRKATPCTMAGMI